MTKELMKTETMELGAKCLNHNIEYDKQLEEKIVFLKKWRYNLDKARKDNALIYSGMEFFYNGTKYTIIEYFNYANVLIEADNGYKGIVKFGTIKNSIEGLSRGISNPLETNILGNEAFIGVGPYGPFSNKLAYKYWLVLLRKCYTKDSEYSLSPFLKSFQNFCEWHNMSYYTTTATTIMRLTTLPKKYQSKTIKWEDLLYLPARLDDIIQKPLYGEITGSDGEYFIGTVLDNTSYSSLAKAKVAIKELKMETIHKYLYSYKNKFPESVFDYLNEFDFSKRSIKK